MPAPRHIIDLYEQHGIDHSTALTDDELSELAKRKGCASELAPAPSTIAERIAIVDRLLELGPPNDLATPGTADDIDDIDVSIGDPSKVMTWEEIEALAARSSARALDDLLPEHDLTVPDPVPEGAAPRVVDELSSRDDAPNEPPVGPALSTIAVPVLPVSAEDEAIVERAVKNALIAKEPPAKKEKPARIGGKFVKKAKVDPSPSDG